MRSPCCLYPSVYRHANPFDNNRRILNMKNSKRMAEEGKRRGNSTAELSGPVEAVM
jgi:hypothetical protein